MKIEASMLSKASFASGRGVRHHCGLSGLSGPDSCGGERMMERWKRLKEPSLLEVSLHHFMKWTDETSIMFVKSLLSPHQVEWLTLSGQRRWSLPPKMDVAWCCFIGGASQHLYRLESNRSSIYSNIYIYLPKFPGVGKNNSSNRRCSNQSDAVYITRVSNLCFCLCQSMWSATLPRQVVVWQVSLIVSQKGPDVDLQSLLSPS